MPVEDRDLVQHTKFRGLRNNVDAGAFALDDLVTALNVDIDDELWVHRRKGYSAPVVAGVDRDIWSNGSVLLGVGSNVLKQVNPDWSTVTLVAGLDANRALSYASVGDRVFYSNGAQTGVIQNGQRRSWGLELPAAPPAVVVGGALRPGRYQYSVTYIRNDGQESGAPRSAVVELTGTGGFELTLPVSSDPTVEFKAVYVSAADGEKLFRHAIVSNATTVFAIRESRAQSVTLATQFLTPPPAGEHIAYANGRLLVAAGNRLYPSEPYAPEWFDLRKSYPFPSRITMVAPLEDGTWLGTDTTIVWLPNAEPEKWEHKIRAHYGAIPGTAVEADAELIGDGSAKTAAVFFMTSQGPCAGLTGGQLISFTQDRYAIPAMNRGAGVVRRHRGLVQYLATLQGVETPGNAFA